jgi:hypothetical protein
VVPKAAEVKVAVGVLGPDWVKADRIELYANGRKIREAKIDTTTGKPGVKWVGEWILPAFRHDVHLVAIASGPGVTELYWPISKPYQATSPVVKRRVIGASGAVWLDSDGDGERSSAFAYAQKLIAAHGSAPAKLLPALAAFDEAVAVQVASLLQARGNPVQDLLKLDAVRQAGAHVERGFQQFAEAWRDSQIQKAK